MWFKLAKPGLKIHKSGAKKKKNEASKFCMWAENDTKTCVKDGPHPPIPAYKNSLSHHVQISFLWLSGTPPPSLPSICFSCQLSNAFESGKDTHMHKFTLAAIPGMPDCPALTTCQENKWQLVWRKKKKNTYRAVFTIKAGVVSFQNVAFLKIFRPVILDVLREFLIGAVGCGNSRGH